MVSVVAILFHEVKAAEETDAQEIVRQVSAFSEGLKGKFGYRMVSGEAHINHWFVMLNAVKKISSL
jgi:hypothetical protein